MGGKSSSPDYYGAAVAQGELNEDVNRDQTYANRPNQYTPWGYTTWSPYETVDPETGETVTAWDQYTGLTPELQDILNKEIALQSGRTDIAGSLIGRMGAEFSEPMDWSNLHPMGYVPQEQFTLPENLQRGLDYSDIPGVGDPTELRARAEQSVYDSGASRLASQYDAEREQLEVKLRNQGLTPEDQAWQDQFAALSQQEVDAYGQLEQDAIAAGLEEQAQLFEQDYMLRGMYTDERQDVANFYNDAALDAYNMALGANAQNYNMSLTGSQYANEIRQQQIAEDMQKRGWSLNEINALLYGQQVAMPGMPSFSSAGVAEPAPIYQGTVDQGNYDASMTQGLWSGLGELGAAYISGGYL